MVSNESREEAINKTLIRFRAREEPELRIICLPYAGGSASIYGSWADSLPTNVEVVAVQLSGRANRFKEPAMNRMEDIINELSRILPEMTDKPYILFGHSLGAKIVYELAYKIEQRGLRRPLHVIVSACEAPHRLQENRRNSYLLPDEEFISELKRLNGTPKEIFDNALLLELSLPVLRADFELSEKYLSPGFKIGSALSVIYGSRDEEVKFDRMSSWSELSKKYCKTYKVDGSHFYINTQPNIVIGIVERIIEESLETCI
jgi:surfactin synthase thioesterase subunit